MSRRLRAALALLRGLTCTHRRMRYAPCAPCVARGNSQRCGNMECPDCGLFWNDNEW